jgi:hypothetical protein
MKKWSFDNMNMKNICIISILAITIIGSGCIDKISEKSIMTDGKAKIENLINTIMHNNTQKIEDTNTPRIVPSPEATIVPSNISSPEATVISDNASSQETNGLQTEDKSVTKVFNIGQEYNMLGVNVKLVNITDYDNNTATLLVNNVEYKYDPASDTTIQTNGVEIIDLVSSEDDKTAEITVGPIAQ